MSEPDAGPDELPEEMILLLDGFEGPLHLLLELARAQKVDLGRISILALVEQFLAIMEGARRVRLELAADWLVMAAWLAWLKSRLLLPEDEADPESGEPTAEMLAARLRELEAVRLAAGWLAAKPQLGHDVFARGEPEDRTVSDRSRLAADLPALLRAYRAALHRAAGQRAYRPRPVTLWTVQDAMARLASLLESSEGWTGLDGFVPPLPEPLQHRAARASTLLAGLELARSGELALRQDSAFGPILVRAS